MSNPRWGLRFLRNVIITGMRIGQFAAFYKWANSDSLDLPLFAMIVLFIIIERMCIDAIIPIPSGYEAKVAK